jgi:acyl dehydratase
MNVHQHFFSGQTCNVGGFEISPEAITQFAGEYDPQAHHLDEIAAVRSPLQGLAASGWQTCILTMHQVERYFLDLSLHTAGLTIGDIRWLHPARPGDVMRINLIWGEECRWVSCRNLGGRMATITVCTTSGALVLRISCSILLSSNPGGGVLAPGCADLNRRRSRVQRRPGGHLVRYFEDVQLGDEIVLGSCCFTSSAIRAFRQILGKGTNAAAARDRGENVDSWHVIAMWTRLIVDYYHTEADWLARNQRPVPLLGPAAGTRNLSWCASVYEGDRITFNSWVEHKVGAGTSKDWGMLVVGAEGVNSTGKTVVSFYPQFLLQKRPQT